MQGSPPLAPLPERLLPWFAENRRELPWRADREPYHVWLSEIMLQQTRVEAVRGYYERFLRELPTVYALAEASETLLLKLWEGLGYYTRVRNLQRAAKQIVACGAFPQDYDEVLSLPGIGAYTAGAICSICFERPTPAVDGNVLRVLSRYLMLSAPPREAKKTAAELLAPIYPVGHCGDFTQALMELGATVCMPNGMPRCEACPLNDLCLAKCAGVQLAYPVPMKKHPRRVEQRTVLLLRCGERLAVCRRPKNGLLAGLWQLPDTEGKLSAQEALAFAEKLGVHPTGIERITQRTHIFTHIEWDMTAVWLTCAVAGEQFSWFTREELREKIGLPTAYRKFLEQ